MGNIKGFMLDRDGDVVIESNEISIVTGNELLRQKVERVLGTNLGEWFLDWEEGISFQNIHGKGVTEETMRYEVERGISQADESLTISDFNFTLEGRTAKVTFTAVTAEGEEIGGEYTWA